MIESDFILKAVITTEELTSMAFIKEFEEKYSVKKGEKNLKEKIIRK